MSKKMIRIGNAGGYWGDDAEALARQVNGGHLDYISMDFLAEITMSIMQKQRSRDPQLGFARDFIPMLKSVLRKVVENNTKIITNAGGINPQSCARAISHLGKSLGLDVNIGLVLGDDILEQLSDLRQQGVSFTNMETAESFAGVADRIQSANIYFGAAPVVASLADNPHIIITGRVTDTGITLAPMVHEFGWALNDWDKLAAGIVAGHILECGSQSTGGNFTDWHKVSSFENMGFPIVEMNADGSFVVTKHEGTGGIVTVDTVKEQLFYEMGNPKAYLTPDVVADFTSIQLRQDGKDRVHVSGIRGYEPTPLYKVSMAYSDGYKGVGSIVISGPHARKKAEAFRDIFWQRCGDNFEERAAEFFGWNACHRSLSGAEDGNEIILRLGVRSQSKDAVAQFGRAIPGLILAGPPGVTATGGVPRPQEVVSYWPALMKKSLVKPKIALMSNGEIGPEREIDLTPVGDFQLSNQEHVDVANQTDKKVEELLTAQNDPEALPLEQIALARSGDKGDTSNIGIFGRSQKAYEFLGGYLTAQRMKDLFQELCFGTVTRYSLPNLGGYNFLLDEALGGGGTKTLRVDAQGKTFAQALLAHRVHIPKDVLDSIES